MTRPPTFDDIFAVMSAASMGETRARVSIPEDPALDDVMTRLAMALNLLLDDLAFRSTEREQMLETLRESEARKSAIFESALDCIITIDSQGQVIEFNSAAEAVFGYPRAAIAGKSMVDLIIPPSLRDRHRRGFERYLATGKRSILGRRIEMTALRADGSEFPVELSITRVPDSDPPIFTGFLRDITGRKQAEEQLRYQAHLLASVNDAIIASDARYILKSWNFAAEKMYGWKAEEVIGRHGVSILQTEFPGANAEEMRRQIAEKGSFFGEATQLRKDGQRIHVEIASIVLRDKSGQITDYVSVNRDITERKRAEEQNRFQAKLVASVADAIIATDMQLNILSWNSGAESIYGWKAEEVVGQPAQKILDTDFLENTREAVTKQIMEQGHWQGEVLQLRRDGTRMPTLSSVSLYKDTEGKPAGVVAVNRDITELKRAEEALRENERNAHSLVRLSRRLERAQSYSAALNAALDEVKIILGYQSVWTYLLSEDKRHLRLLTTSGGKSQEIAGEFPTLTVEGDRFLEEIVEAKDIVLVEDARSDPRTNKEIVSQLGNRTIVNVPILLMERHLGAFGTGSFGDEGVRVPTAAQLHYLRALASHMAVTLDRIHLLNERNRAEEDIRKWNEELEERVVERTNQLATANQELANGRREIQNIFDSMTTLNAQVAPDGRLLLVNKIAAQASGLSTDELMKTNFLEGQWWAFDTEVQNRVRNAFAEACAGKSINYDEKIFVFGRVLTINFSLTPMFGIDGGVEYILAEGRDITRLKEIEEALQARTAQLEAANQELDAFSFSVSHDLRAPLRTIDGFSLALLEDYGAQLPAEGHGYLERVRRAVRHMAALIDDLLDLSRVTRAPMRMTSVDLSRIARDIAAELQSTQPERRATFTIAPHLKGRGDAHLLQAVLENLLGNAWKYSSKREHTEIEFGAEQEGNETIYFVRDNGAGFDMAFAGKLFAAFQRLHETEEFPGTGVGLATVQRIIHRHGGRIWAEAEVDRGASFFFTLPSDERARHRVIPKKQASIAQRAKEII
jgi:PAS domain S-box-containing protein